MGYQETKAYINANIKPNGKNEITGSILNTALNDVLDSGHEEVIQLGKGVYFEKIASGFTLELLYQNSLIGSNGQVVHNVSGHNVYKLSGSIVELKRKIVLYNEHEGGAGFYLANCFDSNNNFIGGIGFLDTDGVLVRGTNNILIDLSFGYDDISYILINVEGTTPPEILISKFNNESQQSKLEEAVSGLLADTKLPEFEKVESTVSIFQTGAVMSPDGAIVSNQYTSSWTIYKLQFNAIKYHTRVVISNVRIGGSGIGVVSAYDSNGNLIKVLTTFYNRHYTAQEFDNNQYQNIIVDLSELLNVSYLLICEENPENREISCYAPIYNGENQQKEIVISVDKNGLGDFTTIKDAVEFANDRNGNCTILVNPGEYDIIEEFGGASYTENLQPGEYYGLKVGKDIKIIGNGNGVILKALYSGTHQPMTDNFSIFNAEGSFHLENLELIAQNVRYCVHDDMPGEYTGHYQISYKNCKMTHLGTNSTTYPSVEPLGGGCRGNSVYEIDGCVFSAPTRPWGASYHNNSTTEKAKVIVKNCYFVDCTFMLYCYEPNGSTIDFIVCNNSMASAIERVGSDINNKLTLIDFNNEIHN